MKLNISFFIVLAGLNLGACNKHPDGPQPAASSGDGAMMEATATAVPAAKQKEVLEPQLKPEHITAMTLTEGERALLHKHNNNFVVWRMDDFSPTQTKSYPYSEKTLPYAVKGDYNGDGIEDLAVSGHDMDGNLTIVLLSSRADFKVVEATRNDNIYKRAIAQGKKLSYTPTSILILEKRGKKLHSASDSVVDSRTLKNDAFLVKYASPWPNLYEWNSSKDEFDTYGVNCEIYSCT